VVIGFGCCVGSWEKLANNILPHVGDRPLIALSGQSSIAVAYNTILDAYRYVDLDAIVLLHDDLEITDPAADAKLLAALASPDALLAGVAGGSGHGGLAWWNHEPVGHQLTDAMNIDFGPRTGDVTLLEGSLLAFSPAAVATLRFDTRFTGFHGYDEIGMQVIASGGRCVVADVDTHHHSVMGFKTAASHAEWLRADELYREKWGL
jgi:hypothetical protein